MHSKVSYEAGSLSSSQNEFPKIEFLIPLDDFGALQSLGWIAESWDWNIWKSAIETSFNCLGDDSFSRIFLWRLVQEGCTQLKTYLALLIDKERKTLPKVIWSRPMWKYRGKHGLVGLGLN